MKTLFAALLLALLTGCATTTGVPVDRSLTAKGQSSRVKFVILHYTVSDLPQSISEAAGALNVAFAQRGLGLKADVSAGVLRVRSVGYGSAVRFSRVTPEAARRALRDRRDAFEAARAQLAEDARWDDLWREARG